MISSLSRPQAGYLVLSTGRRAPEKFRLDVIRLQFIRSHPQGFFVDARGHTFQQQRRVTGTTKIVHIVASYKRLTFLGLNCVLNEYENTKNRQLLPYFREGFQLDGDTHRRATTSVSISHTSYTVIAIYCGAGRGAMFSSTRVYSRLTNSTP